MGGAIHSLERQQDRLVATKPWEILDNLQARFAIQPQLVAPDAHARGIELNYQQQLLLPGPLNGFGAGFNYTYVDSEGEARPGETTQLPFT